MTKPDSIVLFDRLFLGSMALGILNFVFEWSKTKAALVNSPEIAAAGLGTGFIIATFVGGMILNLIIWYFISARASKIAKWIFTVFFVVGLLFILTSLNNPLGPKGIALAGTLVITALQGAATYMLFRPDAIAWFDSKHVDPGTFN